MGLLDWLYSGRSLEKALNPTKVVKIHGIKFTIRKLRPLDYLNGANALKKVYDTYQKPETSNVLENSAIEKVYKHYIDVFMGGIVSAKCLGKELVPSRKPPEESEKDSKIYVENFLTDWSLAESLYNEIFSFTYGKKKIKLLMSQKAN